MGTLNIYQTKLEIGKNQVVEDISEYLTSSIRKYRDTNFQYVKPALETSIKIEIVGDTVLVDSNVMNTAAIPVFGNYVSIYQGQSVGSMPISYLTWYYFITGARWISQRTVELDLALDTLNTFWTNIKSNMLASTHITRQHKDRITPSGTSGYYYRIIDPVSEGFAPTQYKNDSGPVYCSNNAVIQNTKWYLIYKTASTDTDSEVNCYTCADSAIPFSGATSAGSVTWTESDLELSRIYYFIAEDNVYPSITPKNRNTMQTTDDKPIIYIYRTGSGINVVHRNRAGGQVAAELVNELTINTSTHYYYGGLGASTITYQISDIREYESVPLAAGNVSAVNLNSIGSINRYDNTIIKIIELPYPPFTPSFTGNYINLPTGWTFDYNLGLFKLNDLNQEFLCSLIGDNASTAGFVPLSYYKSTLGTTDRPQIGAESKLWNSEYFTLKYSYDSFTHVVPLENLRRVQSTASSIQINYKASNNISNYGGFKFTPYFLSKLRAQEDFDEYLIYSRDNEIPLYTSEWLNYLKYGKRYDEKVNAATITKSVVSFAGTAVGGAMAGFTASPAKLTGTIVGAVVGAIVGAISLAASTVQTLATQDQKEAQYQNQATTVSGNNDLNMLNWYTGGNKLWHFTYQVSNEVRNALWKLFFYTGYKCDEYAVPNLDTRYWFNYIECEPQFNSTTKSAVYNDYIDEIKQRFALGVTVLHHQDNTWDFDQEHENWETSCL